MIEKDKFEPNYIYMKYGYFEAPKKYNNISSYYNGYDIMRNGTIREILYRSLMIFNESSPMSHDVLLDVLNCNTIMSVNNINMDAGTKIAELIDGYLDIIVFSFGEICKLEYFSYVNENGNDGVGLTLKEFIMDKIKIYNVSESNNYSKYMKHLAHSLDIEKIIDFNINRNNIVSDIAECRTQLSLYNVIRQGISYIVEEIGEILHHGDESFNSREFGLETVNKVYSNIERWNKQYEETYSEEEVTKIIENIKTRYYEIIELSYFEISNVLMWVFIQRGYDIVNDDAMTSVSNIISFIIKKSLAYICTYNSHKSVTAKDEFGKSINVGTSHLDKPQRFINTLINDLDDLAISLSRIHTSDFSDSLIGRYRSDNEKCSGEVFRDDILLPKVIQAINHDFVLHLFMDSKNGHSSSWIEEVFGGMIRKIKSGECGGKYTYDDIVKHLYIRTPMYGADGEQRLSVDTAYQYMEDENKRR